MRITENSKELCLRWKGDLYGIGMPIQVRNGILEGIYGEIAEIRTGEEKKCTWDGPEISCNLLFPVAQDKIDRLVSRSGQCGVQITENKIQLQGISFAPEELTLLRFRRKVAYALTQDYALDGVKDKYTVVFEDKQHAQFALVNLVNEEQKEEYMQKWQKDSRFIEERSGREDYYAGYLDGEWTENHFEICIEPVALETSDLPGMSRIEAVGEQPNGKAQ